MKKCPTCNCEFEPKKLATSQKYCSRSCQLIGAQKARVRVDLLERPCEYCGKPFRPRSTYAAGRFCSRHCLYEGARGSINPAWKGGRYVTSQGYIAVHRPLHPNCWQNGYIGEHRVVMEKKLGRYLKSYETVHHKNGVRSDNDEDNLQVRIGKHGAGFLCHCGDCGSSNIIVDDL